MSAMYFEVEEHVIPCQHIREYAQATKSEGQLRMAVKQYKPNGGHGSNPNAITIIAAHGNGIPKECYEPLWEELIRTSTIPIKSIWIADCSHQGASGVLNEHILGHNPNWFDHSRDLLHMVNHFRDGMTSPIFGIAHSFSCSQFTQLSMMHPSLFQGLVFLEPMIQVENPSRMSGPTQANFASHRPDIWPSRAVAESELRSSPFFRTWDSRAVDKYMSFGLRSVPTAVHPLSDTTTTPSSITLTTSKAQEAWTYLNFNVTPLSKNSMDNQEYLLGKDMSRKVGEGQVNNRSYVTTCPSAAIAFEYLAFLRPSILYVFGEKSHINRSQRREDKLRVTGTGTGGNGGTAEGRVEGIVVPGSSHMLPLEKVSETVTLLAEWLNRQIENFNHEKAFLASYDSGKSKDNQAKLSEKWMEYMKKPAGTIRPLKPNL